MTSTRPRTDSKSCLSLTATVGQTFRSLKDANYRTYAIAQLISSCGSRVQVTAIRWLVFELSGSSFLLGLVSFLGQSPLVALGMLGGWFSDHADRKRILYCTRLVMLLQALALAILTVTGQLQIWHICLLAATLGVANALDQPAKQALTYNIVGRKNVVNAVSLNSSGFHVAKTLGPIIAVAVVGVLGMRVGEASCFLLNGLTFVLVLVALFKVEVTKLARRKHRRIFDNPHELIGIVLGNSNVTSALILGGVSYLLCMQYVLLMPVFAKTVFQRSIDGYGMLMSAAALGSFVASLSLAHIEWKEEKLSRVIAGAALGFGVLLVIFSFSVNFYLSCFLVFCTGFFATTQISGSTSLIQLVVDDSHRGRLLGVWMITKSALGAVGGLLVGWYAGIYGAPATLCFCGLVACGLSLWPVLARRRSGRNNADSFAKDSLKKVEPVACEPTYAATPKIY